MVDAEHSKLTWECGHYLLEPDRCTVALDVTYGPCRVPDVWRGSEELCVENRCPVDWYLVGAPEDKTYRDMVYCKVVVDRWSVG